MNSWVERGQLPKKVETRGKAREVLVARSMFDPAVFKMKDGVLMFTKAANRKQGRRSMADMSPRIYDQRSMESLSSE